MQQQTQPLKPMKRRVGCFFSNFQIINILLFYISIHNSPLISIVCKLLLWPYFAGIVNKYKIFFRWLIIFSFPLGNQQLCINIQISEYEWWHLLYLKGEYSNIFKQAFILFQFSLSSLLDLLSLICLQWKDISMLLGVYQTPNVVYFQRLQRSLCQNQKYGRVSATIP